MHTSREKNIGFTIPVLIQRTWREKVIKKWDIHDAEFLAEHWSSINAYIVVVIITIMHTYVFLPFHPFWYFSREIFQEETCRVQNFHRGFISSRLWHLLFSSSFSSEYHSVRSPSRLLPKGCTWRCVVTTGQRGKRWWWRYIFFGFFSEDQAVLWLLDKNYLWN